jgi:hypothetical protein
MGTLVLSVLRPVNPADETRLDDRVEAVEPRDGAPAPEAASPLAEAAEPSSRAPHRFDLDL